MNILEKSNLTHFKSHMSLVSLFRILFIYLFLWPNDISKTYIFFTIKTSCKESFCSIFSWLIGLHVDWKKCIFRSSNFNLKNLLIIFDRTILSLPKFLLTQNRFGFNLQFLINSLSLSSSVWSEVIFTIRI